MLRVLGQQTAVCLSYHLRRISIKATQLGRQVQRSIEDYLLHISRNLIQCHYPAHVPLIINYLHLKGHQPHRLYFLRQRACVFPLALQQGRWMRSRIWQVNNIGQVLLCPHLHNFSPRRRSSRILSTNHHEATCNGLISITTISPLTKCPTLPTVKDLYPFMASSIRGCQLTKALQQALITARPMVTDHLISHPYLPIHSNQDMGKALGITNNPPPKPLMSEVKHRDSPTNIRRSRMPRAGNGHPSHLRSSRQRLLPDGRVWTPQALDDSAHPFDLDHETSAQ